MWFCVRLRCRTPHLYLTSRVLTQKVVGSVSGAVLIAIYGLARRQLYHLFASAGPTVVMGKGSKKGFTF